MGYVAAIYFAVVIAVLLFMWHEDRKVTDVSIDVIRKHIEEAKEEMEAIEGHYPFDTTGYETAYDVYSFWKDELRKKLKRMEKEKGKE